VGDAVSIFGKIVLTWVLWIAALILATVVYGWPAFLIMMMINISQNLTDSTREALLEIEAQLEKTKNADPSK